MLENTNDINRGKIHYLFLILFTVGLGLFSRSQYIPISIYFVLGDILYALLIFFILGFLYPKIPTVYLMFTAFLFCVCIELSQLYQADWIVLLRETKLGGLVLGHGFLWSDILAYSCGVTIGGIIEWGNT